MLYEEIPVLTRSEIEACFQKTSHRDQVTRALLSAALYDDDFDWVQQQCLNFLTGPDTSLRCTALVGLGHLARLHGRMDQVALDHLAQAELDPALAGYVSDVRDDIEIFITRKR